MRTGKHSEQRKLACRELHQRMRRSFRRRRYICGRDERKQHTVRLKPERKHRERRQRQELLRGPDSLN